MTHAPVKTETRRDVNGMLTLQICACGSVWHNGCLGGHDLIVAFLAEVGA